MKKFLSFLLSIAMICSLSTVAFAAEQDNTSSSIPPIDLKSVLARGIEQTVYNGSRTLPDGSILETTVRVSAPRMNRSNEGETTVTTIREFWNATKDEVTATVSLKTDFWFNGDQNIAGWSDASIETWISPAANNLKEVRTTTPAGTTGTSFGRKWIKVSSTVVHDLNVGSDTKGTIWNKVTSDGKFTASD